MSDVPTITPPDTLTPNDRALFGEAHWRAVAASHAFAAAKAEVDAASQHQQSINAMLGHKYALTEADRLDLATGRITRNAVPAQIAASAPATDTAAQ